MVGYSPRCYKTKNHFFSVQCYRCHSYFIGKKRIDDFLNNGATYSHHLNVLLPSLIGFIKAPELPAHIRGELNHLRDLRNQMAHEGKPEKEITPDEMAKCLCGALFPFHYLNIVADHL